MQFIFDIVSCIASLAVEPKQLKQSAVSEIDIPVRHNCADSM